MLLALPAPVRAQPSTEAMAQARRHYNTEDYDAAIEAAREVLEDHPEQRTDALLLLGRAFLERHRITADPEDLAEARRALRGVDPAELGDRSRVDLAVGLGQALYLDGQFRAAASLFSAALEQATWLSPTGREKVADWWGTAMDRHAQTRDPEERRAIYVALHERMEGHLGRFPDSSSAPYWMAAAALARGELDLAWQLALAAWVQAPFTPDRGAALRADVDRLVVRALVPQRVKQLQVQSMGPDAANSMLAEWELAKEKWTRR